MKTICVSPKVAKIIAGELIKAADKADEGKRNVVLADGPFVMGFPSADGEEISIIIKYDAE